MASPQPSAPGVRFQGDLVAMRSSWRPSRCLYAWRRWSLATWSPCGSARAGAWRPTRCARAQPRPARQMPGGREASHVGGQGRDGPFAARPRWWAVADRAAAAPRVRAAEARSRGGDGVATSWRVTVAHGDRAGLEESDEASSGRKAPSSLPRGCCWGACDRWELVMAERSPRPAVLARGLALASGRGAGGRRAARAVRAVAGTGRGRPRGP
jgi:hypothetical protein